MNLSISRPVYYRINDDDDGKMNSTCLCEECFWCISIDTLLNRMEKIIKWWCWLLLWLFTIFLHLLFLSLVSSENPEKASTSSSSWNIRTQYANKSFFKKKNQESRIINWLVHSQKMKRTITHHHSYTHTHIERILDTNYSWNSHFCFSSLLLELEFHFFFLSFSSFHWNHWNQEEKKVNIARLASWLVGWLVGYCIYIEHVCVCVCVHRNTFRINWVWI